MDKPLQNHRRRAAFTLVEVLVAGCVLALLTCALLEGIIVAGKVSHEDARYLAAEALAFDLAWTHFNRAYKGDLKTIQTFQIYKYDDIGKLAPPLADAQAQASVTVSNFVFTVSSDENIGVGIHSEVTWWSAGRRQTVCHDVYRGNMERTAEK